MPDYLSQISVPIFFYFLYLRAQGLCCEESLRQNWAEERTVSKNNLIDDILSEGKYCIIDPCLISDDGGFTVIEESTGIEER